MDFENDIFISYAHIDDQALLEGQKGWVSSLHRALQVRVAQLLGMAPRIWRDPKLEGNDVFADKLVNRLPRTAVLLSVLSPRYARSEWCIRELREFRKAAAGTGGLQIEDKLRIFKVVKTPIPLEQQPPEFIQVLGYEFFVVDPETGRPRELDQAFGTEAQREYWAKLDDLAHDLCTTLTAMAAGAEPAPGVQSAGEEVAVYLAETTFDLREERSRVARDLTRRGYRVLPDQPLPLLASELEALVRESLARCRLSVHLVGANYGVVPEGARQSIVALQNQLAVEHAGAARLDRLIWMPPGLETDDERQGELLEHLRSDAGTHEGADLLQTPLEDLKTAILDKLRPAEETAADETAAAGDDAPTSVYLICDQRDEEVTPELEDFLFDRGFEVTLPVFEGDEAEVRQDHEENLRLCDAVLFYYGAGNDLWLRRQLRELRKSAGYGRDKPIRAKAIWVAPPDTPRKKRLRTREALVIQAPASFDPAALEPFLTQLEAGR